MFNKYPALWGNDFDLRDLQGNGDRVEYRIHWRNYAVLQAWIMYDYQGYMIFMYYLRLPLRRFLDRFCINLSWKKVKHNRNIFGITRNINLIWNTFLEYQQHTIYLEFLIWMIKIYTSKFLGSEFLNAFFFASFILMHPFTEAELEEILSCKQIFQMKSMHIAKDRRTRPFLKPTWLHVWSQELVFFCEDMHSISGSNGKRLNFFTFQVSTMTVYFGESLPISRYWRPPFSPPSS